MRGVQLGGHAGREVPAAAPGRLGTGAGARLLIMDARRWRSSAMISPSRRSGSAGRFSAVAAAIAEAASVALPSPTLRTERRSSSSSASRFARSAASARARADSAAPASASAPPRLLPSAFASVAQPRAARAASRTSRPGSPRAALPRFASSSSSSTDAAVAAAGSRRRARRRAPFPPTSSPRARAPLERLGVPRARRRLGERLRRFSAFSSFRRSRRTRRRAKRPRAGRCRLAESARISSRGVPLEDPLQHLVRPERLLVFLSSTRAALARALCSCASARASMPSRCACSATPQPLLVRGERFLHVQQVLYLALREAITLRALDVVRYRESSTETSPNVTVSCRRRRAGQVVGRETGFLGFTRRVSREARRGLGTMARRRERVVVDERPSSGHARDSRGRAGRSRGCRCRFRASYGRRRPRGWRVVHAGASRLERERGRRV